MQQQTAITWMAVAESCICQNALDKIVGIFVRVAPGEGDVEFVESRERSVAADSYCFKAGPILSSFCLSRVLCVATIASLRCVTKVSSQHQRSNVLANGTTPFLPNLELSGPIRRKNFWQRVSTRGSVLGLLSSSVAQRRLRC